MIQEKHFDKYTQSLIKRAKERLDYYNREHRLKDGRILRYRIEENKIIPDWEALEIEGLLLNL